MIMILRHPLHYMWYRRTPAAFAAVAETTTFSPNIEKGKETGQATSGKLINLAKIFSADINFPENSVIFRKIPENSGKFR